MSRFESIGAGLVMSRGDTDLKEWLIYFHLCITSDSL